MFKKLISFILLFTAHTAMADSPLGSDCYPHLPEAQGAPIGWIYLGGLRMPDGQPDTYGFRSLERINRRYLNKMATNYFKKYHVRMAIPTGNVGRTGFLDWNSISKGSMLARASQACGGATLAANVGAITFSNGAKFTGVHCGELSNFSPLLMLGAPQGTPSCGRAIQRASHHPFPYVEIAQAMNSKVRTARRNTGTQLAEDFPTHAVSEPAPKN